MFYMRKLVYLRELKKITQNEVANFLNISLSTYNNYETEYELIPIKYLNDLANFFNVSIDYLFNFNDAKNYGNIRKEINNQICAKRLKELRKHQKITQETLSKILNVSQSTIAKIETEKNIIATPFLYQICKTYNISADYLLGKTDTPKYLK